MPYKEMALMEHCVMNLSCTAEILFFTATDIYLLTQVIGDEALALVPLRSNQHAYQVGKLVETALHQLVVRLEKALDQQEERALGVFLDIKGAFNNTCYNTMWD
jgi:hypothetical protein